MCHIMLAEGGKSRLEKGIVVTIGNSPLHQLADTIAYKAANIIERMLRQTMGTEGEVHRGRQIS